MALSAGEEPDSKIHRGTNKAHDVEQSDKAKDKGEVGLRAGHVGFLFENVRLNAATEDENEQQALAGGSIVAVNRSE
jgi:hypothetical protein